MMKTISNKVLIMVLACVLMASAGIGAEDIASEGQYGETLSTDMPTTPIASILSDPDLWAGKRVRVAGQVSGVCTRQGCWMDLTAPENSTLRVKVDDGVIVFPADAKGHSAVAEGDVEILDMDRDGYEAWMQHVAEEEGREFDPEEIGSGPYRVVRLRGVGAQIEGL